MDVDVIEITPSVEERNGEYADIYQRYGAEENDFLAMWSSYLAQTTSAEFVGLRALWKLSKTSSFDHSLNFSASFLVLVTEVDYSTLSAGIRIIDDEKIKGLDLPREMCVPFVELHIIEEEEIDRISVTAIARCLDQLRVFYKYLWWPWDGDLPDSKTWFSKNLQQRLKLYEDLALGRCSELKAKKIKTLIEKGKLFYNLYLKETESIVRDDEASTETKRRIVEYVNNIEMVKESLETLMKKSLPRPISRNDTEQDGVNTGRGFLVMNELNWDKMVNCTQEITESYPSVIIKRISQELENILSSYEIDDTIFLSPGEHSLRAECLNTNVVIRGSVQKGSMICGESSFWYLLKTTSDNISLHNLAIRSEGNPVLIYIKEGITCMDSVTMVSSTDRQKAIIVEQRATLIANECQFNDFNTAIVCLPGSAVQLTKCVFQKNSVAIEILGDAQVCLNDVTGVQSRKAFITYRGNEDTLSSECTSLEELSNVANVSIESVNVDDAESAVQFV